MVLLKVTWKKSAIGRTKRQRRVIESLGLKRLNHSVIHKDSPSIRGMVHKVTHLLHVEEISEAGVSNTKPVTSTLTMKPVTSTPTTEAVSSVGTEWEIGDKSGNAEITRKVDCGDYYCVEWSMKTQRVVDRCVKNKKLPQSKKRIWIGESKPAEQKYLECVGVFKGPTAESDATAALNCC